MDLTVIIITVVYIGFIFTIGVLTSKGIHNTDDFLLAGREVRWFFLACTLGATVVGGGYSIGAVGETYDLGLLMLFASMGGYMQFIFAGFVVAPKFRKARVYTVAMYMSHRFGDGPRVMGLILSLLFSVFVIAAQMAAIGHVLAAMFPNLAEGGALIKWAVVIGGIIVIIYSAAGGLKAVILTDVFQFLVLIIGFVITAALVLPEVSLSFGSSLGKLPDKFFDPTRERTWIYLVSLYLTFLLGETFAPGYVTRFCAGRDKREIKIGIGGVGIFLTILMPVVVFLIAVYARLHFPDVPKDRAMALVIEHLNHPVIAGLIIAALLSAVMSSADSALNSATAIFIKDIFEQYFGEGKDKPKPGDEGRVKSNVDDPDKDADEAKDADESTEGSGRRSIDDHKTLVLSRALTVGLGVLAIAVAVVLPDIIDQLLLAYVMWAPGMIVPIVIGTVTGMSGKGVTRDLTLSMIAGPVAALAHKWLSHDLIATFLGARVQSGIGTLLDACIPVDTGLLAAHGTTVLPPAGETLATFRDVAPAVLGVVVSAVVFSLLSVIRHFRSKRKADRQTRRSGEENK